MMPSYFHSEDIATRALGSLPKHKLREITSMWAKRGFPIGPVSRTYPVHRRARQTRASTRHCSITRQHQSEQIYFGRHLHHNEATLARARRQWKHSRGFAHIHFFNLESTESTVHVDQQSPMSSMSLRVASKCRSVMGEVRKQRCTITHSV